MRVVITLVTVGVAIYALVDCLRSRPGEIRGLPKVLWLVAIVVLPLAGAVAYLVLGRVTPPGTAGLRPPGRRVVAPDDDPEFLRSLRVRRPDQTPPPATPPPPVVPPAPPAPPESTDDEAEPADTTDGPDGGDHRA
jgi:hypothetical protein